jgi:hypothetical protein
VQVGQDARSTKYKNLSFGVVTVVMRKVPIWDVMLCFWAPYVLPSSSVASSQSRKLLDSEDEGTVLL